MTDDTTNHEVDHILQKIPKDQRDVLMRIVDRMILRIHPQLSSVGSFPVLDSKVRSRFDILLTTILLMMLIILMKLWYSYANINYIKITTVELFDRSHRFVCSDSLYSRSN